MTKGTRRAKKSRTAFSADTWMGHLGKYAPDVRLRDLVIPGTHDSDTYTLRADWGMVPNHPLPEWLMRVFEYFPWTRKYAVDWGKAQRLSVLQQLEAGVRYLDLRFALRAEDHGVYTCHGLYGQPAVNLFLEIRTFLNQHPREVVFLDIQELNNMQDADKKQFLETLQTLFGDKMAPVLLGTEVTLGKMQQKGFQLITFLNNQDIPFRVQSNRFWPRNNTLASLWINTPKLDELKEGLKKAALEHQQKYSEEFFVMQAMRTPDTSMVVEGLTDPDDDVPHSLADLAKFTNPAVMSWFGGHELIPNIFIMDDCSAVDFMSVVMGLNHGISGIRGKCLPVNQTQPAPVSGQKSADIHRKLGSCPLKIVRNKHPALTAGSDPVIAKKAAPEPMLVAGIPDVPPLRPVPSFGRYPGRCPG